MNRLQKTLVISAMVDKLHENGSWGGETHLQKALYFLQELFHVPTDLDFTLYKHGPFSFELRDELSSMRADDLLDLELQPYPYGPKLQSTSTSREFRKHFTKMLNEYDPAMNFVAEKLGDKGVAELERLATALYVRRNERVTNKDKLVRRIVEMKPHISFEEATEAVSELDVILSNLSHAR